MDRRKFEQQIAVIRIIYRAEARRSDDGVMQAYRERAHRILDELELTALGDRDLEDQIAAVRDELGS